MSTVALNSSLAFSKPILSRQNQRRLFVLLVGLADALAISSAFGLAYVVRFEMNLPFFDDAASSPEVHRVAVVVLTFFWLVIFGFYQLYNLSHLLGGTHEYSRIFTACAVAPTFVILVSFLLPYWRLSRGWMSMSWVLAFVLVSLTRFGMRRLAYRLRCRGLLTYRTLIVGTDEEACAIGEQLKNAPTTGAELVGFVANHTPPCPRFDDHFPIVGGVGALPELVKSHHIEEVILSTATLARDDLIRIFEAFANSDQVELRFSSGLYELFTTGVHVREIGNVPLTSMNKVRLNGSERLMKGVIDRVLAVLALVGLSPILVVIAIWIKLDSPGPVLHRRRVLGSGGREFDALKFRTMYTNGDEILAQHPDLALELQTNVKLKEDPRITRAGKRLRRFSLDELPQLLNVLLGQMSLIGPRMITPEESAKYGKLKFNLLTVKPGLSGLWQVRGRSDVCYEDRVRLDMYYIRNYSIWLDLQTFLQTIPVIWKGKGAY